MRRWLVASMAPQLHQLLQPVRRCHHPLRIPSVQLAAPRSHTHEDIAYASCPACSRVVHMCDMLTHLITAHRELDQTHCRKMCTERLALYERVIGVPLKKSELTSSGRRVLDFLPTVLPTGYMCNWCDRRSDVYATRDKFLKHVADVHTDIDLEEVEPHVPLPPRGVVVEKSNGDGGPQPTRRLNGVVAVAEKSEPINAVPRILGISLPRGVDRPLKATAQFSDTEFPCELCNRTFNSEIDLLQHLETRHPDGTAEGPAGVDSAAIADVAQFSAKEATTGGDQRVHVICDLCVSSSKVYKMPSALFSHIRFKHPNEDAAFHVERLIREQKTVSSFVCTVCQKAFASAAALDGHFNSKHAEQGEAQNVVGRVTANNCWWCHDCEKGFSSAKGLHGHMQNKHGLSSQTHPCPACKRVFADIYSLEEHLSLQHKTIRLSDIGLLTHVKCSTCERFFLSHEDLHRHAVKHHKKDPRAPAQPFEAPTSASHVAASTSAAVPSEVEATASPQGPRKVKKRKKTTEVSEVTS
ncbi:mitochondrial RNA binding protein 1 [Trypanosoma equiperdum]|uniref:REH2-associated factor 1 n=3 Tax=Trypanozoon TaxID=39700 RepID=H2F1_TRYB2|nr:RecName: Full=REH2-associated factor 1; Flags: Precursor [Trypanosoma brucei brucei TREU927]SCU73242.1 mitochondrial RNA binding protein 1 [Trypanosoma equiperdum]